MANHVACFATLHVASKRTLPLSSTFDVFASCILCQLTSSRTASSAATAPRPDACSTVCDGRPATPVAVLVSVPAIPRYTYSSVTGGMYAHDTTIYMGSVSAAADASGARPANTYMLCPFCWQEPALDLRLISKSQQRYACAKCRGCDRSDSSVLGVSAAATADARHICCAAAAVGAQSRAPHTVKVAVQPCAFDARCSSYCAQVRVQGCLSTS